MSLPPINPPKSAAGITVDPRTLQRVVPPTKRADGSVRKELKIRPGFTPQEDVALFRTARQAAVDARKPGAPGRVVPGWAPPADDEKPAPKPKQPKPPKTNAGSGAKKGQTTPTGKPAVKGKGKAKAPEVEAVKDSWEDEEDDGEKKDSSSATAAQEKKAEEQEYTGPPSEQLEQDATMTDPLDDLTDGLRDTKI